MTAAATPEQTPTRTHPRATLQRVLSKKTALKKPNHGRQGDGWDATSAFIALKDLMAMYNIRRCLMSPQHPETRRFFAYA